MKPRGAALLAASLLGPASGGAEELSLSGFGTLGYARSDKPYNYQRFINDAGTFRRDSVLGVQADGKLTDEIGFTVQVRAGANPDSEGNVSPKLSWAFVSWRPTNDLLIRFGKLRVPFYLHSETADVGTTYDFARLPDEVYSQSPTNDFAGAMLSRSWSWGGVEGAVDAYWGRASTHYRDWMRDGFEPYIPQGANYFPMTVTVPGLTLTLRRGVDTLRIGYTRAKVVSDTDRFFIQDFPYVPIPGLPGVGYYQTTDKMPGPGLTIKKEMSVPVLTLGADIGIGNGFRVIGEYGRRVVREIELGYDTAGRYVAVTRRTGSWIPYLLAASLRSTARTMALYNGVNSTVVPNVVPGAASINALQRVGADGITVFDQSSVAVGASYVISPNSRLKAEFQQVRVGDVSKFVDSPAGGDNVSRQNIRVLSISYNVVF